MNAKYFEKEGFSECKIGHNINMFQETIIFYNK